MMEFREKGMISLLLSKMYTWLLLLKSVKTGDSKFSLSEMKSSLSWLPQEILMQ